MSLTLDQLREKHIGLPARVRRRGLIVRDVSIPCARRFVGALHRHSGVPLSGFVAFGAWLGGELVGVAIVGRPVSRILQARGDAEVTRLCTDGTRNACSLLYAAARRWARAKGLGLVTYTLGEEPGASLAAVGARIEGRVRAGRTWSTPARPRAAIRGLAKLRWRLAERPKVEQSVPAGGP